MQIGGPLKAAEGHLYPIVVLSHAMVFIKNRPENNLRRFDALQHSGSVVECWTRD